MKLTLIFALLTVCAPIIAHAQTDDTPAVAALPLAPASAATADGFVWRFAPPVGSRWTMRSFARGTSNTQIPATKESKAQSVKFAVIQKFTADYDVLSRDTFGATTIRLTLREMSNDVDIAFNGETAPSPKSEMPDPKAVNGATFTFKQAPDGAIWGVVGMRAFQRKLLEASGLTNKMIIDSFLETNQTEAKAMIAAMSLMTGTLPVSPVRVGESWNYKVTLPLHFAFEVRGQRTLKVLDSEIAVVADSARFESDKPNRAVPIVPNAARMDYGQLSGRLSGTSRVQRSSGLPLETMVTQVVDSKISPQVPSGSAEQNFSIPIHAVSSTRIVLEPRD